MTFFGVFLWSNLCLTFAQRYNLFKNFPKVLEFLESSLGFSFIFIKK